MFRDLPKTRNVRIVPTAAKGMVNKITNGWIIDSNSAASTIKTRITERMRANDRFDIVSFRLSSSPVISIL